MEAILYIVAAAAYIVLIWRTTLLIGAFCGLNDREDKKDE